MENLRNRINVQLVNNEKDYLKCTSQPNYMSHKIFDNNLVAIPKSKVALKLKGAAADMRYFARSTFFSSYVYRKNFSLI